MSTVSSAHSPFSRHAVPISDTPSAPGKASGNMVRAVAVKGMARAHSAKARLALPRLRSQVRVAIQAFTCSSSTSSGTEPEPSTTAWKALMSKRSPSAPRALSRSSSIFSSPIL